MRARKRAHARARERESVCAATLCAHTTALTCARVCECERVARPQDLLVAMLEEVSKQAAAKSGAVKKVVHMRKKRAGDDVRLPALRGTGVASIERVALADLVADCKGSEIR